MRYNDRNFKLIKVCKKVESGRQTVCNTPIAEREFDLRTAAQRGREALYRGIFYQTKWG